MFELAIKIINDKVLPELGGAQYDVDLDNIDSVVIDICDCLSDLNDRL